MDKSCFVCGSAEGEHGTELEMVAVPDNSVYLCEEHCEQYELILQYLTYAGFTISKTMILYFIREVSYG
jgi:hypothetical protein